MNNIKIIFGFIFLLLIQNISIAQKVTIENIDRVNSGLTPLNLHSASFAYQNKGFTLTYNVFGFYSPLGEINIDYRVKNKDSYYLVFSLSHLLVGIHKVILNSKYSTAYINVGLGTFLISNTSKGGGYIGISGLSYLTEINANSTIELAINGVYHDGAGYNESFGLSFAFFQTRGIVANITYALNIFDNLTLSLSSGYSYSAYKYANTKDPYMVHYDGTPLYNYRFVSRRYLEDNGSIGKPKWKAFGAVPFGVAISYHF